MTDREKRRVLAAMVLEEIEALIAPKYFAQLPQGRNKGRKESPPNEKATE